MIEALLQAERLLIHGQIDQAEKIYSGAVERDPRNSIAVVGLARVALERGDERLAYERACAALAIDPENAAALRLEARLSEVFSTRGEPVQRPSIVGHAEPPARRPEPAAEPVAAEDARPSEQTVFTRNPSMSEHQLMEERRASQREHEEPTESPTTAAPRKGLLDRIFGTRDQAE
jgi:hypothetical protein